MRNFHAFFQRIPILTALLAAFLLAGGCTTFNHDWAKAAKQPPPADDMLGRWQGVWVSEVTGHKNELRCVVTPQKDGIYRARFHAKYKKGWLTVTFGYPVLLNVEKTADTFKFTGDADLGWVAGGVYQYEGRASATNFFSTYSCKYDHGTFQMSRP